MWYSSHDSALCVSVTQKGGEFGRLLKPGGKPRRKDDNGLAGAAPAAVAGTIRVVAVADWQGIAGAMAFASGDTGELVYASNRSWLCVRVGENTGWVPADYWRIVTDVSPSPSSACIAVKL